VAVGVNVGVIVAEGMGVGVWVEVGVRVRVEVGIGVGNPMFAPKTAPTPLIPIDRMMHNNAKAAPSV
jgi:hypothetical protein